MWHFWVDSIIFGWQYNISIRGVKNRIEILEWEQEKKENSLIWKNKRQHLTGNKEDEFVVKYHKEENNSGSLKRIWYLASQPMAGYFETNHLQHWQSVPIKH